MVPLGVVDADQVLKLQAENDQLKIQELEDRRRIQHLLALTQPVTQEVCVLVMAWQLALSTPALRFPPLTAVFLLGCC